MKKNDVIVKEDISATPVPANNTNESSNNDWAEVFLALTPFVIAAGWTLDKIGFSIPKILSAGGRIHFKKGDLEFNIDPKDDSSNLIVDSAVKAES